MKTFLDNGYQHINGDGDPDLSLDGVLRCSVKGLDAQMLFDPFEEQFDFPSGLVKKRNGQSGFGKAVAQKHELFSGQGIDISNPTQNVRIIPARIKSFRDNYLVEANAETFVYWARISSDETEVFLGSSNKECSLTVN